MEKQQKDFIYTYSAKQQEEVQRIRQKYLPKEENKIEQLRKLDESVTKKAIVASIASGIVGSMLLGTGMSLCMTNLGKLLGMNANTNLVFGMITGVLGIFLISLAYPMYRFMKKREQERIAPKILRLSEELLQENLAK